MNPDLEDIQATLDPRTIPTSKTYAKAYTGHTVGSLAAEIFVRALCIPGIYEGHLEVAKVSYEAAETFINYTQEYLSNGK